MPKSYHQLTYAQRCQIYILKQRGDSPTTIAKELGVHRSTIIRELKRNTGQKGYRHKQAQQTSETRRAATSPPHHKLKPKLIVTIQEQLKLPPVHI